MEPKYEVIPKPKPPTFKDFGYPEIKSLQEEMVNQITEGIEVKIFNLLKERLFELKEIKVDRVSDLGKYKGNLQTFSFELEDGSVKFDTFFDDTLLLTIVRDFKMEIKYFDKDNSTTASTGFKYC